LFSCTSSVEIEVSNEINCENDLFKSEIVKMVELEIPVLKGRILAFESISEILNDNNFMACRGELFFDDFSLLSIRFYFNKKDLSYSFELDR
tara:strand:+ start:518 stop:793 length:276 start_codon:yes stop_codon:yes gene_type:complete